MTSRNTRSMLLSAAVAAALGFTAAANAQYRVNNANVLDSNNRDGGAGNNPNDSDKRVGGQLINGNDIVYGNVTGGKQFRGQLPYTDPRAFRGQTSDRNLDDFIKQSSGPDSRLAETVMPFYGVGRGVPPPPGFVQTAPGT